MDVGQLLAWVGGTISLLLAIGAGLALVKGSYGKARIQALREDNDDFRKRLDDSDKELAKAKAREDALDLRCSALESENKLLKEMVTQRAQVVELTKKLDEHHEQAMDAWHDIATAVKESKA